MNIKKNIAVSETGFVFNPGSGESFTVNATGTELLNYIMKGISYSEISKLFIEKYDTNIATFDQDFNDFVDLLERYNLLAESKSI